MKTAIKKGDIVESKAGHDAGRIYVVAGVMEGKYLSLVDCEYRWLGNPKKKKESHVRFLSGAVLPEKIKDTDIRMILKTYKESKK